MAIDESRKMTQETMLGQIEQVLRRGKLSDTPAYTLILGAGASFGSVPTAKQMLGIKGQEGIYPQCIPVWLRRREDDVTISSQEDLETCVVEFWKQFFVKNPSFLRGVDTDVEDTTRVATKDGIPEDSSIAQAYTAIFNQRIAGGVNTAAEARTYLRDITLPASGLVQLNGTHFFLASLLSLQRRIGEVSANGEPQYIGKRPFARTVFTTNFDPLLQTSLQLFQLLYYMTDRPDRLTADALQTDDHSAIHLFYAHGSVHRPFLANTRNEIEYIAARNEREIASYIGGHGVIVLGYSGWDDCLLRALKQTSSFAHNLYWMARAESSISPEVGRFLHEHPNAYWVQIDDGGEFMALLHRRLCPGMRNTELLNNPIKPLREQLQKVVLTGIKPEKQASDSKDLLDGTVAASAGPTTPEEFRQQILRMLLDAEDRLSSDVNKFDPEARLRQAEHQADLAYSDGNWKAAADIYTQIIEDSAVSTSLKSKAYARRGYSYSQLNKTDQSLADYTSVINLPDAALDFLAMALVNRGIRLNVSGEIDQAIADYTRAIDLPTIRRDMMAAAFLNRGIAYGKQDKRDNEIADYTKIIDLPDAPASRFVSALISRGVSFNRQGKHDRAVTDYTRVIDLPGVPAQQLALALNNRGVTLKNQGETNQAISDFSRVIENTDAPATQLSKALFNRGAIYGAEGKTAQAIADYTKIIEMIDAPPARVSRAKSSLKKLLPTGQHSGNGELGSAK